MISKDKRKTGGHERKRKKKRHVLHTLPWLDDVPLHEAHHAILEKASLRLELPEAGRQLLGQEDVNIRLLKPVNQR